MISLRPGFPADVAELIAIDTVAHQSEERRQAITNWVEAGECHVALRAGRVVGYAALTRSFFHSPFLEMLMVAEPDRRSGVGRALIEHCARLVPDGDKFWTSTNASNLSMRALLAEAGFIESGVVENLDEGDPELVFLRRPAA